MQTWRQIQGNLRFWVTLRAILLALLTELCLHADPTCCLFRVLRYKKRFTKIRIFTGPWEGLKVASMCQNNFETFLAGGTNAPILTQEAPILAQEPSILEPNPLVLFTLKSSTTKKKFTKKRVLRCPWEGLKVAPMGQNNFKKFWAVGTNATILTPDTLILAQEPSILAPNPLIMFRLKSCITKKSLPKFGSLWAPDGASK